MTAAASERAPREIACPRCGRGRRDRVGPDGVLFTCGHRLGRDEYDRLRELPTPAVDGHDDGDFPRPVGSVDRIGLVLLSEVEPKPVRWLWRGRIPLGKLTVLDGDPGLGKSALMVDLAARVSSGVPMPDSAAGDLNRPAGVVLLSAEDGLDDTIRPRLDAASADPRR